MQKMNYGEMDMWSPSQLWVFSLLEKLIYVGSRKPLYHNTCAISGRKLSRYGAEAAGQSDSCI